MCGDGAASGQPETSGPGVSRRQFMGGTTAAAAGAFLFPRLPLRSAARAAAADGSFAYSMAMHIHAAFSEQSGSMDSQLFQAATNSVDVLWWTDHDYGMNQ